MATNNTLTSTITPTTPVANISLKLTKKGEIKDLSGISGAKSLTIDSSVADSSVMLTKAPTLLSQISLTGSKALTIDSTIENSNLTVQSSNSAGVNLNIGNGKFAFKGGAGNDKIAFQNINGLDTTDTLDFGAGIDTMSVKYDKSFDPKLLSKVIGLENLELQQGNSDIVFDREMFKGQLAINTSGNATINHLNTLDGGRLVVNDVATLLVTQAGMDGIGLKVNDNAFNLNLDSVNKVNMDLGKSSDISLLVPNKTQSDLTLNVTDIDKSKDNFSLNLSGLKDSALNKLYINASELSGSVKVNLEKANVNEVIATGSGNDFLYAHAGGKDQIIAGAGADTINFVGSTLVGSASQAQLVGGSGADNFNFIKGGSTTKNGDAIILDFSAKEGDTISFAAVNHAATNLLDYTGGFVKNLSEKSFVLLDEKIAITDAATKVKALMASSSGDEAFVYAYQAKDGMHLGLATSNAVTGTSATELVTVVGLSKNDILTHGNDIFM